MSYDRTLSVPTTSDHSPCGLRNRPFPEGTLGPLTSASEQQNLPDGTESGEPTVQLFPEISTDVG